jgi:acetylornithine deacetylase/succinyl-diaminopimelate desuccinylase-like protein
MARCRARTTQAVLAAAVIERLAVPGPTRVTPVMARFLDLAADELPAEAGELLRALSGDDPRRAEAALAVACDPMYARALRALLRDTISPDVVHAGIKYNVIPGDAVVEVDCRVLPGTTEPAMRGELIARLGPELAGACTLELIVFGAPCGVTGRRSPLRPPRVDDPRSRSRRHPVAGHGAVRDGRQVHRGTRRARPTASRPCGWTRTSASSSDSTGIDERVSVDALRWGLPVLYDVVRGFCG